MLFIFTRIFFYHLSEANLEEVINPVQEEKLFDSNNEVIL
jgi:hypothetical protein